MTRGAGVWGTLTGWLGGIWHLLRSYLRGSSTRTQFIDDASATASPQPGGCGRDSTIVTITKPQVPSVSDMLLRHEWQFVKEPAPQAVQVYCEEERWFYFLNNLLRRTSHGELKAQWVELDRSNPGKELEHNMQAAAIVLVGAGSSSDAWFNAKDMHRLYPHLLSQLLQQERAPLAVVVYPYTSDAHKRWIQHGYQRVFQSTWPDEIRERTFLLLKQ
eukprot:jgi/Chlat1/5586/Chrsp369S05368